MDSHKREEAMANDRGWKWGPGTEQEQEQECSTRALARTLEVLDVVHELVQELIQDTYSRRRS